MKQDILNAMSVHDFALMRQHGIDNWSPKDIAHWIHTDGGIIGQDAAVRSAALIVYNHYEGRPSVSLFIGPTGSGKTEIWRALQREYGSNNIVIHDASTLSAEGWKGSNKISSIFRAVKPDRRERIILVLDEADKIFEPMYGANGTNYSDLLQNQLLRLCDHDTLFFGRDDGLEQHLTVDCSGVSIVLLGAFSKLTERKSQNPAPIGFHRQTKEPACHFPIITTDDLIDYGMRAEIASRINRIVHLEPLDIHALIKIGQTEVTRLTQLMDRDIIIDPPVLIMLARMAQKKGLGARWLKSRLNILLDDLVYDDPDAPVFHLTYEPADADQRRQAKCITPE